MKRIRQRLRTTAALVAALSWCALFAPDLTTDLFGTERSADTVETTSPRDGALSSGQVAVTGLLDGTLVFESEEDRERRNPAPDRPERQRPLISASQLGEYLARASVWRSPPTRIERHRTPWARRVGHADAEPHAPSFA